MKPEKVIDLSFSLHNDIPVWFTQPGFVCERVMSAEQDEYTLHVVRQMSTHTGTHVDAPLHFVPRGKAVDELDVEAFVGEGVVIDLSWKKAGEAITVGDLMAYDEEFHSNDVLMLSTGWDRRAGPNPEYLFEWPYLVEESAEYLVAKRVRAIGVDTMSVGGWDGVVPAHRPIARTGSPAETHRILLRAGVVLVEVLRNLDRVLEGRHFRRAFFIFAPVAIRGAEGGPCRALAFL